MGTPEWGADVGATEKGRNNRGPRQACQNYPLSMLFRRRQLLSLNVGTWEGRLPRPVAVRHLQRARSLAEATGDRRLSASAVTPLYSLKLSRFASPGKVVGATVHHSEQWPRLLQVREPE